MQIAASANGRDGALDIVRGLALVTITINHLTGFAQFGGMRGFAFPTLSHWGFSSAAEIFFLISGYLVGAIYLPAHRPASIERFARIATARAGRLYVNNLLLFLIVAPLCLMSPALARHSSFGYFLDGGPGAWASFLLLYLQPYCLEILVTYMVLLIAAPAFAWGLLRRPWLTLAASALLYLCAHEVYALKLPGGTPAGDWRWNFSPASWQFLFFGAMAAGRFRLLDRLQALLTGDGRWFVGLVLLLAGLTLLYLAQTELAVFGIGFEMWGQSKVRLGPLRLLHALSLLTVALGMLWRWPALQATLVARQAALIGACSLPAFMASVVISYLCALIWFELAPTHGAYLLLCAAGALMLLLFVHLRAMTLRLMPRRLAAGTA